MIKRNRFPPHFRSRPHERRIKSEIYLVCCAGSAERWSPFVRERIDPKLTGKQIKFASWGGSGIRSLFLFRFPFWVYLLFIYHPGKRMSRQSTAERRMRCAEREAEGAGLGETELECHSIIISFCLHLVSFNLQFKYAFIFLELLEKKKKCRRTAESKQNRAENRLISFFHFGFQSAIAMLETFGYLFCKMNLFFTNEIRFLFFDWQIG